MIDAMENSWLSDRLIYCERGEQAFVRRACRPLESYLARLDGLPVSDEWAAAESQYLHTMPEGVACKCPACQLRAPGSAGILWNIRVSQSEV